MWRWGCTRRGDAHADSGPAAHRSRRGRLPACAGWAAGKLGKSRKEGKALTEGVKSLLRGQIIDLGLHYIKEGEIPPYGLDNLENYYTAYVDLGDGDRSTHDIMQTCRRLPIRSGE